MMTCQQAFHDLKQILQLQYDPQESAAISHEVLYHITGLGRLERLVHKETPLSAAGEEQFRKYTAELRTGRPVQYVLGQAWFAGRVFEVNEHVLIPRPETEELVQWVSDDIIAGGKSHLRILDIGTGSGCIPITIKLAAEAADVSACDVSPSALTVAAANAERLEAKLHFFQLDILDRAQWDLSGNYSMIISNPPYIPFTEKDGLDPNVRDFEPSIALFAPGDDALLFYREIADFGKEHLDAGGAVYCELHTDYGADSRDLFFAAGYKEVTLRKDMHGHNRMLKAIWYG